MADIALAATGIVLSPYLQVFFERMASREFDDFFQRRKVSNRLLRKLKIALLSVNAVLEDAEDRQFTETSVKEWLHELKDTVYDAEDILDEIATKDLQQKLVAESRTIASKVRHSISASLFDVNKMEGKIKDVIERLEDLAKLIGVLGLRAGVGGKSLERLPTTSLIEESKISGRDDEKKVIINSLLSNDASGNEIGVIAIVGMGGIGKTTLAQLVYNDNKVKEHFYNKVWVCVSDPFNVFMVMKTIMEAVTLSTYETKKGEDLNKLQNKLKETLTGKKFLLVLDDVWDTDPDKWEVLCKAFELRAQGSRVIVTTRDSEVAGVMHARATHHIMELSEEECWSLFKKYAFHDGNSHLGLEEKGKQIVKKCKGLPLAIKAIGALLWPKLDVDEWDKILTSELWDLPIEQIGILPALRLSYKYLSSHLKRCFAYCSIFPKDYAFKKDKLILLWMAEGLLPQLKNKTMEEVGNDYFLALVSRSLFQRSNCEEYIMHDLVSDLTKFISKQFALSLVDECPPEKIVSNTRHLSFHKNFKSLQEAKRLHTVLELNSPWGGIFGTQFPLLMTRCLRVLNLSCHWSIAKLPYSIGKLIHLRYLDVSHTSIKRLPDSICKLCNLQILNLSHCLFIAALPRDMHKLINLRHLNITETDRVKKMPRHLGRLKGLQTLTKFVVGKHGGSGIEELGKLTNLRGSLSILDLQNFETSTDIKYLRDNKYLEELELRWKDNTSASEGHINVLDCLQPHSNLKRLVIKGYASQSFPDWVGFSNLASLRLQNCKFCCSLPSLGQLPSLQDLYISGLFGVITVGPEFYGTGSSSIKPFGALQVLKFEGMLKWEEWFSFDAQNEGRAFPQLKQLEINNCPKIKEFGITNWGSLPSLPERAIILKIIDCPQIESFPEGGLPSNLNEIYINNCGKLYARRMGWGLQNFPCVRRFSIGDKSEDVESFPEEGLLPTSLTHLIIEGFPNLKYLDKKELQHLTTLLHLMISDCPKLECMPDGLPASLSSLSIDRCPLLENEWKRKEGEEWRKIAHVPKKEINGIRIE